MGHIKSLRTIEPDLPVLFTHVPKTGGSTITGGMATTVGHDNIAGISTAKPDKRRDFLEQCRKDGKRYVYGHFRFSDTVGIYDDANFIMALRHPLDRILSFYFMLLRADPRSALAEECLADIPGKGFALFHERLVQRRREDNLMCRYLSGEPDHERAIKVLNDRYCLAWDNEGAEQAWRKLHRKLRGQEPRAQALRRRNDAPVASSADDFASGARPKDYSTFLPPENVERVEEANREDYLLFDWFKTNSDADALEQAESDGSASLASPASANR